MTTRASKPEFYKSLMEPGFYPEANKNIKYQESGNYWIFKTGQKVYKVRKPQAQKSAIDLDLVFCQETERTSNHYSPSLETQLKYLVPEGEGHVLADAPQPGGWYLLVQNQLADRGFLSALLEKDKLKAEHLKSIAAHLAGAHQEAKACDAKSTVGSPEDLKSQIDALIYQSKKHMGDCITQPMIDMTMRPVERFLETHKKLLGQRARKGFVKAHHGCVTPEKIHLQSGEVALLARREDPLKHRFKDVASDVADLSCSLVFAEKKELAQGFVEEYVALTKDEQLKVILPLYQLIFALAQGLHHSLLRLEETPEEHQAKAKEYYELMVELARTL